MKSNISAVIAVYGNWNYTTRFLDDFFERFPTVPIAVSCLGNTQEFQDELKERYKDKETLSLATGSIGKRVSFSENWNGAINAAKTEKVVFVHDDMYIDSNFFTELDECLTDPKELLVYMTVEPLTPFSSITPGRPGKVLAPFGLDWDKTFKKQEFLDYVQNRNQLARKKTGAYGFFLSGYKSAFEDVGGFDQDTFNPVFCEDDDLNIRLKLKGYQVNLANRAVVYHFGSKTTRDPGAMGMSVSEIEMNRKFARKWGLEARFLWLTGYEYQDRIDIGTEKIAFRYDPAHTTLDNVLNAEPLVDYVCVDDLKKFEEYATEFGLQHKFVTECPEDTDIVIAQIDSGNFNLFANAVGSLRWNHKILAPGTKQTVGPYEIEVRRTYPELSRMDSKNYLSVQKSKKYE